MPARASAPAGLTGGNRRYLELKKLHVAKLVRGYAWLDTGTHDALLEASEFVRSIQHRQGLLIGCPEVVAYLKNFINVNRLREFCRQARQHGRLRTKPRHARRLDRRFPGLHGPDTLQSTRRRSPAMPVYIVGRRSYLGSVFRDVSRPRMMSKNTTVARYMCTSNELAFGSPSRARHQDSTAQPL